MEPRRQAFSLADRFCACDECGAPLRLPLEGGTTVTCLCGVAREVLPRPDVSVKPSTAGDERARLDRLRRQVERTLPVAPGLENLISGSFLEPDRVGDAQTMWGLTRRRLVADPSDAGAAERLVSLTVALANAASGPNEDLVLRGLYEGSVEVLVLPRHRQLMLSALARRAARAGEGPSARSWLERCDPRSEDLLADSSYRLAQAFLAVDHGEWASLDDALGTNEVPVHISLKPMAAVLRAHARLCAKDPAGATAALADLPQAVVDRVLAAMPARWGLDESLRPVWTVMHAKPEIAVLGLATRWWVIPLVVVVIFGGTVMELFKKEDRASDGELIMGLVIQAFMAMVVLVPLVKYQRSERLRHRLLTEGLSLTGQVVSIVPTGTTINDIPMLAIAVRVSAPGHTPATATFEHVMLPGQLRAGDPVKVRWDPLQPTTAALDQEL